MIGFARPMAGYCKIIYIKALCSLSVAKTAAKYLYDSIIFFQGEVYGEQYIIVVGHSHILIHIAEGTRHEVACTMQLIKSTLKFCSHLH